MRTYYFDSYGFVDFEKLIEQCESILMHPTPKLCYYYVIITGDRTLRPGQIT